tara:strand:+ start:710 stop:1165 length:456 start_codon:yes stop_codon:yes gene_type:complete
MADEDDRVRGRRRKIWFGKDRMPEDASEEDKKKMRKIYREARTSPVPHGTVTANRLANVGGYKHVNDGKGIAGQIARVHADSRALDYWYPDEDGKMVLRKAPRNRRGSHGTQSGIAVDSKSAEVISSEDAEQLERMLKRNDGGIAKKTRHF